MKTIFILLFASIVSVNLLDATEPAAFDTKWIPSKPEMLTYTSTSPQGDGVYQISVDRRDSLIEIYLNIITKGFTKTVAGTMTLVMVPIQSTSKIIVNGQIVMDTHCWYEKNHLHIATLMRPYNQTMERDIAFGDRVIDFSQVPLAARTLHLTMGAEYSFESLRLYGCGERRIRTYKSLRTPVFKTGAIAVLPALPSDSVSF